MRLLRQGFPDRPAFGTAVSDAILKRVASGDRPATLRLHRPARELAFAKQDRVAPGFGAAVQAAHDAGFEPVIRLAGGRAAVFHEGTLAVAWASPHPRPVAGTQQRFELMAAIVTSALRRNGVDARIGEVPGEYCPGAWSINARAAKKLSGIGQRMITGAAHAGAVIVVTGSSDVRDALVPVYAALELDWDPDTTGAVEDEVPGIGLAQVEDAILAELGERFELIEDEIDADTLALAAELEAEHVAGR